MYKIKMALMRFMNGRYGNDDLGKATFWLYIILLFLNLFIRSRIIYITETVIVFIYIFRILSKNIPKRQSENYKYLKIKDTVRKKFLFIKNRFKYRKTHVYKKCPNCKAVLRLPKKKGSHICTCPKCHNDFSIKI